VVDSVNIDNVGGDTGIASEVTLQRLLATMELMANKTGADSKMAVKKANEQYKKSIRDLDDATKKAAEEKEKNTKATKKATKAAKRYAVTLGVVTRTLSAFVQSISGLTQQLFTGSTELASFTQHIPLIGQHISVLSEYIDDSFSAFQTLSSSGAAFNNNLNELRYTSATARLSLEDFTGIIQNNTDKLAALGGTATKGAKAMANMTDQLGAQRTQLLNMGFNFEEINEAMIDYAYLTRTQGRVENRNTKQVAERAASYATTLQTLSKLTGESVDKLKEEQQARQNDVAFQLKLSKMGADEQEKVMKGMAEAAAAGPAAAARFKEVVLGMPPMSRATQLFEATMGEAATGIRRSAEDAMNAQVTTSDYAAMSSRRMAEITAAQLESARGMENVLSAGVASGEGIGAELAEMLGNLGIDLAQFGDKTGNELVSAVEAEIEASKEEQKSRSASVGVMANFNETLASVRSSFARLFIESGILDAFARSIDHVLGILNKPEVMGRLSKYLTSFTDSLNTWLTAFSKDPSGTLDKMWSDIGDGLLKSVGSGLKSLFTNPYVLGVLGTSIAALLAKDAIVSRMGASGAAGAASNAAPAGGRSRGRGGRGLGGMLGNLTGGILGGVANGLVAFANPMVIAGAVNIGLVITAIGAGIAGAAWITGKLLPTFVEGMKKFEDLDGETLADVGKGLLVMSGALAAFGVGSAVAGFGSFIGNIGEGLNILTGGQSPVEKLKEFSEHKITEQQVNQIELNARAFKTYAEAMTAVGAGSAMSAVGSIASSISGWFSDSPLEKLQDFADENINHQNLKRNLQSVKDFQAVFSSMGSDNNGTMGLKNLDVDNVIDYAEAIEELTEAIADLNKELKGDSGGGFGRGRSRGGSSGGSDYNAGDLLGQMDKSKKENDVNTTDLIRVLEEIKNLNKRTLRSINEIRDSQ